MVTHRMCGPAHALVRPGPCDVRRSRMHVTEVQVDDQQRLALTVESDQLEHGCPGSGCSRSGTAAAAEC